MSRHDLSGQAREHIAYCKGWLDRDTQGSGAQAPCSRYGTHYYDWRDYAILLAALYEEANGDDPESTLDGCCSLVVNDSGGVAEALLDCWYGLVQAVGRELGITKASIRKLTD